MYHLVTGVTESDELWEKVRRQWSGLAGNLILMHGYKMIGRLCGVASMNVSDWLKWLGDICAVGATSVSSPSK